MKQAQAENKSLEVDRDVLLQEQVRLEQVCLEQVCQTKSREHSSENLCTKFNSKPRQCARGAT